MNFTSPVLIKKLWQIDNFCFAIKWSDDTVYTYQLSNLQKSCPCAQCFGSDFKTQNPPNNTVKAHRIFSVGHYAIRIEFTEGCSAGIYDFDLLRSVGTQQ